MINNAGFGSAGEFEEDVQENDLQMIGVNVRAVHLLTHAALLQMEKKEPGNHPECGIHCRADAGWTLHGDLLCDQGLCGFPHFCHCTGT